MTLVNRFFFFIVGLLFLSCVQNKHTYKINGYAQGTSYNIKYHHTQQIDKKDVDSLLSIIDMSMSTYVEESIISLLNNGHDVLLDSLIEKVIKKAIEICHETNGMFDVTVAPLVEYWGFGPNQLKSKASTELDSSLYILGCDQISIKNNKIVKSDSVLIDLNGIAQGFSVDYLSDYFYNQNAINDFMIELGGEVRCVGDNLGKGWRIGVDKPTDKRSEFSFVLNLNDISLATSGSYRNYYYLDSIRINHTINPKTLSPTQNKLISATILYSDCMSADAYATACMSLGFFNAKDFLNKKDISGCLIYVENQDTLSYFSSDFASFLHRSPGSAPQ